MQTGISKSTCFGGAAFKLPFFLLLPFSVAAADMPDLQQEIENPMQQEAFSEPSEVAPEVVFSEWELDPVDEAEEAALSINEPMYFVAGGNANGSGDLTSRFQISFKYRMFSEQGLFVKHLPWLEKFHLGYTQTSLWNLSADSKPFEDTTYRPSFFWELNTPQFGWKPDYWRFGYEHESNGQAGDESRSVDTLFIQPAWSFDIGDKNLVIAPKLSTYINRGDENDDVVDYRGRSELTIRYGSDDGFLASLTTRYGLQRFGNAQLDLSYPIRQKIFSRAGGYIYLQFFHGYGESLLNYDEKESLRVRLGFAIVR